MEILSQGAEAVIYKQDNFIIKDRVTKNYRLPEIDESLRKFRTKREAKVIGRLNELNIPSPKLEHVCLKDMKIKMQFIPGDKLRDVLNKKYCYSVGKHIAEIHTNDIIHGDLTTSNMILQKNEVYFIDFGLSFFSQKIEDKAVDLHLLKRALESKHSEIFQECFDEVIKGYSENYSDAKLILKRFDKVEMRGRNKSKN